MHPNDVTPDMEGCLVVDLGEVPAVMAGVHRYACTLWIFGQIYIATLYAPSLPTLGALKIQRSIFPSAWTPLPAKPLA